MGQRGIANPACFPALVEPGEAYCPSAERYPRVNSYWFSPSQPIIEASERQQTPGQRHLLWLTRLTLLAVVAGLTTLWLWRRGGWVGRPDRVLR